MERRLFHKPRRKHRIIKLTPPSVHKIPMLTGGLQQLYDNIRLGSPTIDLNDKDYKFEFTDDNGVFQPEEGMPLLAGRYQFREVIGRGQSSVLILALDTFRSDLPVAIKALHLKYAMLGNQETHCLACLNKADPYEYSGTLRIYTTFMVMDHYCMVFEYLEPKPLHRYFKPIRETSGLMPAIRKVAVHILKSLGFLRKQNIIHADLKPDNILLKNKDDLSSLKIVDFGNAIRCVHEELRLYYEDFELQTLLYRAPEVMFGVHFGLEIDMWSLGCILAELYIGSPVFYGKDKESILKKMVSILGPVPQDLFRRGKFYRELSHYTSVSPRKRAAAGLKKALDENREHNFVDFLLRLLHYDPAKRMTIPEAMKHPFLAPEMPFRYFLSEGDAQDYDTVFLDKSSYRAQPHISQDAAQLHMSSSDLLRHGTGAANSGEGPARNLSYSPTNLRKVAQVIPVIRSPEIAAVNGIHIDLTTPPAQPAPGTSSPQFPDPRPSTAGSHPVTGGTGYVVTTSLWNGGDNVIKQDGERAAERRGGSPGVNNSTFVVSPGDVYGVIPGGELGAGDCDENSNVQMTGGLQKPRPAHTGDTQQQHPTTVLLVSSQGGAQQKPQEFSNTANQAQPIVPGHKIRRKLARTSSSSSSEKPLKARDSSQDRELSSPTPKQMKACDNKRKTSKTYQDRLSRSDSGNPSSPDIAQNTSSNVLVHVTASGRKYGRVPITVTPGANPQSNSKRTYMSNSTYTMQQMFANRMTTAEDEASAQLVISPQSDVSSGTGASTSASSGSPNLLPSWDESSGEGMSYTTKDAKKLFTDGYGSDGRRMKKSPSPSSEDDIMLLPVPETDSL